MLTDAHAILEATQWYEGMLLSPQPFQLAACRAEALAHGAAMRLREKASARGESLQSARLQGSDAHTKETAGFLRALARTLPRLEALLQSGVAHPSGLLGSNVLADGK